VLHGHWLREYGIDGSYEKIAIEPGTFSQRIAELRDAGYRGVNVTVPYKEEALSLAQQPDQAAKVAGAANLLVFKPDGNRGAKHRQSRLATAWKRNWTAVTKTVGAVGAGGAARGAALACRLRRSAKVRYSTAKATARQLGRACGCICRTQSLEPGTLEDWPLCAMPAWLSIPPSAGWAHPPLGHRSFRAAKRRRGLRHRLQSAGNHVARKTPRPRSSHHRRAWAC
jgi:shikimate 5-dehydrogenase